MFRGVSTAAVVISGAVTQMSCHISTRTAASIYAKLFSNIPCYYRPRAIQESQKVLVDYLQFTRFIPFIYADQIARNSLRSLSNIVSRIPFSKSSFVRSLERFLRYHPVNELEFFCESIGLTDGERSIPCSLLPRDTFFLSDWKHFNVPCALSNMGFPWKKLGLLCKEECTVFEIDLSDLQRRLDEIKDGYGFNGVCVISICLVFPRVLCDKMHGLLSDLKMLFVDNDLWSCIDSNVDAAFEICEKVKLFYGLGFEFGTIGELIGRSKSIFTEHSKEVLSGKIDFFYKLDVRKDQIGLLLLSKPEIFGFDLESRVISVSGFLDQLGLPGKDLKSLKQKFPHVFGRNRMVNVPNIMRSLDLDEWFFDRMKNGYHSLLGTYIICHTEEDLDKHYVDYMRKAQTQRMHAYTAEKLNFLHAIGFGENAFTIKVLARLRCCGRQMQQRFDCLLHWGVGYSTLCTMVRFQSKILNQRQIVLEKKLEFLCTEMGLSLQFLDVFRGYLTYNLERRIKPRYQLHKWLLEQGFCQKDYCISTIIAASEKIFIAHISRYHPPSAEKWLENSRRQKGSYQEEPVL